MLIPKKTKYRYNHYPKYEGHAKGNRELIAANFSDLGLKTQKGKELILVAIKLKRLERLLALLSKKMGVNYELGFFPTEEKLRSHWR